MKGKLLKETMKLNWNLQRGFGGGGVGSKQKNFLWREYEYFLEEHSNWIILLLCVITTLHKNSCLLHKHLNSTVRAQLLQSQGLF